MSLTPGEIWPMLAGAGVIVFGAGQLVSKIQNGKHVTKDFCAHQHKVSEDRFGEILVALHDIKKWINKDGVA